MTLPKPLKIVDNRFHKHKPLYSVYSESYDNDLETLQEDGDTFVVSATFATPADIKRVMLVDDNDYYLESAKYWADNEIKYYFPCTEKGVEDAEIYADYLWKKFGGNKLSGTYTRIPHRKSSAKKCGVNRMVGNIKPLKNSVKRIF